MNAAQESSKAEIKRQNCSIVDFLETKTVEFKPKQRKSRKSVSKLVAGKAITELETFKKVCEYEQEKQNGKKSKPNEKGKCVKRQGSRSKVNEVTTSETREVTAIPSPSHVMVSSDESDHSDEQDVCCVCRKSSPLGLREILYNRILFVKWAQCEKCGHWVHVKFCTGGAHVRRTSSYTCPCCTNQHVNLSHEQ